MGNDYYETLSQIEENQAQDIPRLGIGDYCELNSVIVDKDCRIGNRVHINGGHPLPNQDTPPYSVTDGIVVIKKGAIINNGFMLV